MQCNVAVAKVGKYASAESGDSFEMIERPHGGLSFVLVDGQRSGKSAKAISNVVARKAISLLADGVRDGAAARAANDYLFTQRGGKVSATLNILSVDLESHSLRVLCNNPAPVFVLTGADAQAIGGNSEAIGAHRDLRPVIHEVPLAAGLVAVAYTDGLIHAGDRTGQHMDVAALLREWQAAALADARQWADNLLAEALRLDDNRPVDDVSVLVIVVSGGRTDDARRLSVTLPI